MPHSCNATNLPEEYAAFRSGVALDPTTLHLINAGFNDQPCSVFGVHPSLSTLASLYQDGDALFVANTGFLSEPVNRTNYAEKTRGRLFGHSSMIQAAGEVDPNLQWTGTGVLGRLRDILIQKGHKTSAIQVDGSSVSLIGRKGRSSGPVRFSVSGLAPFPDPRYASPNIVPQLAALNNATATDSGFMAESWSTTLHHTMSKLDELRLGYESTSTMTTFPVSVSETELGQKFRTISRLQQSALTRGVTRDFYFVEYGSFDHHSK